MFLVPKEIIQRKAVGCLTNLHEKAVLLQILRAVKSPFGRHAHIGQEDLSKILLVFLRVLFGQPTID